MEIINNKEKKNIVNRYNRSGPQKHKCIWCGLIDCVHCQCKGCRTCDHIGTMCSRNRYNYKIF